MMPHRAAGRGFENQKENQVKTYQTLLYAALLGLAISLGGCASSGIERPQQAKTLLWSYPKERPTWTVDQAERDDASYYFIGISQRHSTEKAARDHALVSVNTAASQYLAKTAQADFERTTSGAAGESAVNNANVRHRFNERQIADNLVRKLHPKDWYIEQWQGDDGKPFYSAFVRAQIPAGEVEAAMERSDSDYRNKQARLNSEATARDKVTPPTAGGSGAIRTLAAQPE